MTTKTLAEKYKRFATPYYLYDEALLQKTLKKLNHEMLKDSRYVMHYAIKANANPIVLRHILAAGLGIDCVSGGEIEVACSMGFDPKTIVFSGVGKADWEIRLGLNKGIGCFNVESLPELDIINLIAAELGIKADICLRINPNVGAHTHANIVTGLSDNKFGIDMAHMFDVIESARDMTNINLIGLHFHIGSQILVMDDFIALCNRINELQDVLDTKGVSMKIINVGGGLGIDYNAPETNQIPNFKEYFEIFRKNIKLHEGQQLHFELGRAIVAQCGKLISQVLYVKDNTNKKFVILDAGMTELIRPALYGAHHKIVNISSDKPTETYDVVGPICESSDTFAVNMQLPHTQRGDIVAIMSAGAYGETMASAYNCRSLPKSYSVNDIMTN